MNLRLKHGFFSVTLGPFPIIQKEGGIPSEFDEKKKITMNLCQKLQGRLQTSVSSESQTTTESCNFNGSRQHNWKVRNCYLARTSSRPTKVPVCGRHKLLLHLGLTSKTIKPAAPLGSRYGCVALGEPGANQD